MSFESGVLISTAGSRRESSRIPFSGSSSNAARLILDVAGTGNFRFWILDFRAASNSGLLFCHSERSEESTLIFESPGGADILLDSSLRSE